MSDRLYKLLIEAADVFTAPSPEELIDREAQAAGWTKNPDGSYDADGNVQLMSKDVSASDKMWKSSIRFNKVKGTFDCAALGMTSLIGSPRKVGRSFNCSYNELDSLAGGPEIVASTYQCQGNNLKDLEGAPEKVGGDFDCSANRLTSLEGCPKEVGGGFYCRLNPGEFTEEDVKAVCNVGGPIVVK